jgi:hypothetical protein
MTSPTFALRALSAGWRRRARDARHQASSYHSERGATARLRFEEAACIFDTCARHLDRLVEELEPELGAAESVST